MSGALLRLEGLGVRRGGRAVLEGVSLSVAPGEVLGLIGPNGAGKTTLLQAALGLVPATGTSSLASLTPGARARAAAYLPQAREIAWPLAVADVVALGRLPWGGLDAGGAVGRALAAMDLGPLAARPATALSGGEQARVLIARALAQEAPLILADEPVSGLDPAAQIRAMLVFAGRAAAGHAVVASVHDLGLAARHCTRLVLLHLGRVVADGPPAEVLTPDRVAAVFGLRGRLEDGPEGAVFTTLGLAGGGAAPPW